MKKTVLYVVNDAGFFVSHRLALALAARDAGYDVVIACPKSQFDEMFRAAGLHHEPTPVSRGKNGLASTLALFFGYRALIRRLHPSTVHLITSKPIILAGLWTRLWRIPTIAAISGMGVVFSHNGRKGSLTRTIVKSAYKLALDHRRSHVIFQNAADKAFFLDNHVITKGGCSLIRGAGVDLESIRRGDEPPAPITIMLPSRMLRDKGIPEFVDSARILKRHRPELRFVLQGGLDPANPTAVTEEQIARWVDEGLVEWRDHTADIGTALASAHIVALPSYYGEGLPKTIVDAAAAGRPVVTTDLPGCRDAIEPGVTGLLVRPRDPVDLAKKLEMLVADAAMRRRMGIAARAFAEANFDLRDVVAHHMELYRDADFAGEGGRIC